MTHGNTWRSAAAGLAMSTIGAVAFLFGHGCGSVSSDRQDAINQATIATCNRYDACGLIGSDSADSYASVTDCQSVWRGNFTNQWSAAQCEGHIDHGMLSVCLDAINSTSCTSILDFLNTYYVKCGAAPVCDRPTDAGRD